MILMQVTNLIKFSYLDDSVQVTTYDNSNGGATSTSDIGVSLTEGQWY